MQQVYHSNAVTNVNIRQQIQRNHRATNVELAAQFGISAQTVSKWRNRNFSDDASCVPKNHLLCLNRDRSLTSQDFEKHH
ncbi:MAG: hypothetical protein QM530_08120, partial [Phycisphaerales bacterium]|nr:hypothetical protein [Phycisphaerales bacterium]